jgi:AcrR family transcriptional regulator
LGDHNKQTDVCCDIPTNKPFAGQGGRPRTFQDEDIFRATTRVLGDRGYAGCSMEAVANELGCSAQAIGRRFGSKRGLVRAYLDWALALIAERYRTYGRDYASPLEALRARCLIPAEERPEEISDPIDLTRRANMATFWAAVRSDPELREAAMRSTRDSEEEAARLLAQARAAGELVECDPVELGRTLTAAWVGTTTLWAGDGPEGTLVERLGAVFDTIIGPYRTDPRNEQ